MSPEALSTHIAAEAARLKVPGVAVGIWANDRETFTCHGVTSCENPLPVDRDTLFVIGSVTKTFTATALMRLVDQGAVELDAPVRRYVPELRLSDEVATAHVTVLNLLNHTSGLDWRVNVDTGEGDDALAREVEELATFRRIAPPGSRASYSQAGFSLAGRIIEKVTGRTYEEAVTSLVLDPLGLGHSFFARDDVMTRRFAVGHTLGNDGKPHVARPWRHWRSDNPGAGLASSVADQLRWARFHLGDGSVNNDLSIISQETLHSMKQPTTKLRGSSLGDAIGICWFLRDIGGVRTVEHGGSANGQFANLLIAPSRNFAVVTLSNAGPDAGLAFNGAVMRWAVEHYLGVVDREPEPVAFDETRALQVVGTYENVMMTLTIVRAGDGLTVACAIKPEIRANAKTPLPPDLPPAGLGLLPGGDDYVLTSGGLKGQRGFFTRGEDGAVVGADLAGRLFRRVR